MKSKIILFGLLLFGKKSEEKGGLFFEILIKILKNKLF